jgi:plasmid stability protein
MAQLIVRKLEDRVIVALRARAARNGRSVEAEHRDVLRRALLDDQDRPDFKELLRSMPELPAEALVRRKDKPRKVRL